MNFIKTKDKETYEKLVSSGFQLINEENGIYTFVNNNSKFEITDKEKIVYTNVLFG